MKRLLVIDDEPGHRLMVRAVMSDLGWDVAEAGDGLAGVEYLEQSDADVVLLDMRMPRMDGRQTLDRIHRMDPELPVIMLTAFGTVGSAVEAMKAGAFDYLTKPADNEELATVVEKAHEYGRLLRENESLKRRLESGDTGGPQIVGASSAMRRISEFIAQAGPSEATVLVMGESGTGKELVAEGLHHASVRRKKPLIKVNCAALPANLLESELFGYVKGAFTGAVKDKPGRFQLAQGGTLFLDEIGDMPMELQVKLLRALQERVVEPLGSVRSVPVDVRILAATNRNLKQAVDNGEFREDLYYRLNVLEVVIAPLRERIDDLPLLVSHLLTRLARKNRKNVRAVSPAFLNALTGYGWPGNVRELENVLERALILSRADTLGVESLSPQIAGPGAGGVGDAGAFGATAGAEGQRGDGAGGAVSLGDAERDALVRALDANDGHRERTADALGISRRTLQYKLRKYGLTRRP